MSKKKKITLISVFVAVVAVAAIVAVVLNQKSTTAGVKNFKVQIVSERDGYDQTADCKSDAEFLGEFLRTFEGCEYQESDYGIYVTGFGKQWIRLNKNLELLDTPGILWPKFEDQKIGERLALIGSINDEILHVDELAVALIRNLKNSYLDLLEKRYNITMDEDAYDTLKKIAIARRCLQKGELPDVDRASSMLLEDFRSGKLGRITLERPEEWK